MKVKRYYIRERGFRSGLIDMKRTFLFLTLLFPLATMFSSGGANAADPDKTLYDAAMAAITDGKYYLIAEADANKFYLTQDGAFTKEKENAYKYSVSKVSGGALYDVGILLDPGNGAHYTNTNLKNNYAELHPNTGKYCQSIGNNRNDWERQVFFLNAEIGKFAIRSCNTAYAESSWADAGRTFWTYEIGEAGKVVYGDSDTPIPCYSYEPTYIWTLEVVDSHELDLDDASLDNPIDITHLIVNPDCSSLTGWTYWGHDIPEYLDGSWATWHLYTTNYQNGEAYLDTFIERWVYRDTELEDGALYQTVTDLPNGLYKIEADVIACQQGNNSTGHEKGTYLFAASGDERDSIPVLTENGVPQHFVYYSKVKDNTLTLGMETVNSEMNWIAVDNWKLSYVGTNDDGIIYLLSELSNSKTYTITCERGSLLTMNDYLASTCKSSLHADPANFAILNYEDNFFLYSIADKKFVTNTGTLADIPRNGVSDALVITPQTPPYFMLSFNKENTCINSSSGYTYGVVINGWNTADAGNQYYMVETADFDPTEALAALDAYFHPAYAVTYVVKDEFGNTIFTSDPEPTKLGATIAALPDNYKRTFYTYREGTVEVTEANTEYVVTAIWNGPFKISTDFDNAQWQNMAMCGTWYVTSDVKDGDGAYKPQNANTMSLGEDSYQWAFIGNGYDGFKIINKAERDGKSFGWTDAQQANGGVPTIMDDSEGNHLWKIVASTCTTVPANPFCLNVPGTNLYVNQFGGASGSMKFWESASNVSDQGSAFNVYEVPSSFLLTLTASGNGVISYDNISVRSSSQSFDVAELSDVVLTITPDVGYHVGTLTINGEDALSRLTDDGKLSIGSTTSSVTFTETGNFRLIQIAVDFTPDVPGSGGFTEPFEATPVDNKATYTGNDPYIYDKTSLKFYALNSNGEYEEYGIISEVNTLKVAGNAITEIESIKSTDNAYINLNYIPKANSKAVCTLIAEEGGDWKAIYGCGYFENGWKDRFCFFTTNATINLGGETGNREAMAYGRKIVTVLDAVAGKMDIFEEDGTTLIGTITDSPKTADCKTPLYVFAQNKDIPGGNKQTDCYNMLTKLYGLQLYEGETLVMDLVPAINGEGKGGLKDKLTGNFYASANSGEFELSADGQAMAGDAGIPVYEGKIVIYNNHEYEYFNGSFVDRGEMAYQAVTEIGTDYKNLSNWSYPGSAYDATFGVNVFDGTTNTLSPYEGKGGWEPLSFKITGLTKGESYRASFNYTGTAWHSWSSYTVLPFFVLDNENMPDNVFNNPDAALGYIALPNTATENQPYSTVFTANHNYALLCIQFGVCDDGSHDPAFAFSFGNINVEKRVLPQAYNAIDWADPVKYTPLEYIEAISQALNNPFTLPYIPVTATEIDTKFQVYDTSTGWCGIFCARNQWAGTGISLYMNGNDRAHFGYFTGGTTGAGDNFAPFSLNTDYEVQADVTKLVVNGETYNTGNTVTNATTRQLSLFSNPEWDNPMRGRFYYCNISEGGVAQYNFKPVMRHDGKFGFYDKASRVFIMPAQGKLDGYGYKKLDDQAYVTYTNETRIVIVGSTAQFLPDVQNLDEATFTWTSADESIATVAADGTVTGKAAGKVMITVTTDADQGWTASYELTVSEPNYVRKDVNNVGYAIITGGNGWADSPVANLVDNDATTKFGCSGGEDAWAIIIASEPVAVQQYSFVTGGDTYDNPGRTPRDWKLEGSNDNQNWTVIDQQEQNYKAKTANKEQTVFTVNGTDTYKFFKFTAGNFNGGFQLGELWINEQAHTWGEPTETASTCTVEGKKVWECTDCKVLKTERLPLAAHNYENGVCTVCNAKVAEPILLANGQANDYIVKFRHKTGAENDRNIEEGWNTADFDDSAWDELVMPIGTAGYGVQHTIWQNEYNTFWFRRNFYVENPAAITKLTLKALHDDDYAIYVNGTQIDEAGGWTIGTEWLELNVDPSLLVAGNNVVAVYIEQNWGGAYCDFYLEGNAGATKVLTLTATGNGTVRYGNTSVRSSSQSFDVAELSEVVLTITPDAGYHVETLTINGEDALSQMTDGKLNIGSMTASVTVAVTFANNSDLNDDGVVDVSDIMTIINNIADDIYLAAADLNNDGFVDVGDIMVVINAIIGIHDNTAGVKAMHDVTNSMPATENADYLTFSNEDNIVSIQLDNEFEYSAFQMLVTLPDGVDIDDVIFNSDRLNGFTQFARKVNERQYIIIGFSMGGNVISGSAGKILSLSITGNADDNIIIISDPIFSIPDAKSYKLRVDNSFTTNLQDIQVAQISVRGNTVYVHANNDTMLNIYSVSGALCERKHLHPGVNAIALRPGQYIINNRKVTITK